MYSTATLTPAYGRDYASAEAVIKDFREGKDFIRQPEGKYTSIRDYKPGMTFQLRYGRLRKAVLYTITKDD